MQTTSFLRDTGRIKQHKVTLIAIYDRALESFLLRYDKLVILENMKMQVMYVALDNTMFFVNCCLYH